MPPKMESEGVALAGEGTQVRNVESNFLGGDEELESAVGEERNMKVQS